MFSEQSSIKDLHQSNVKSEAIRRKTFHNWPVKLIDKNHLAAAGFYYTNWKDVVCCTFCGVQLRQWKQEYDPFKEHQRWSPSCGFIKGLFVGNIPIGSTDQPMASALTSLQPNRSSDLCGSWRSKYNCLYLFFCYVYVLYSSSLIFNGLFRVTEPRVFKNKIKQQKTSEWHNPLFPQYETSSARMQSVNKWPLSAARFSDDGVFRVGKNFQHRVYLVHETAIRLKTS